MTLLLVCQDVADTLGLTRPAAILTGTDQISRQMLGLAKETLDELGLMDWPILQVAYSFNTVNGTSQYDLPADFGRETGDTAYAASRYYAMRGSLSSADWARQRNNLPNLGSYKFRIFGNPLKLNLTPTPTAAETVVFEYSSTNRVRLTGGTFSPTFTDDTDVTLMPEELFKKGLKWRFMRRKGLDYSEEFDDYENSRTQRLAQQLALGSTAVAYRGMGDDGLTDGYVPETGYGV